MRGQQGERLMVFMLWDEWLRHLDEHLQAHCKMRVEDLEGICGSWGRDQLRARWMRGDEAFQVFLDIRDAALARPSSFN
jgi:hypothetical protein